MNNPNVILIENARLLFRNFSGLVTPYNAAGDRNFSVVLDPATAEELAEDGWNVKWPKPLADGTVLDPTLAVAVSYKFRAPRVIMVSGSTGHQVELDEETIALLDDVDIVSADMYLRASHWTLANGASGTKAYLKKIYVTIEEDELDRKYASEE